MVIFLTWPITCRSWFQFSVTLRFGSYFVNTAPAPYSTMMRRRGVLCAQVKVPLPLPSWPLCHRHHFSCLWSLSCLVDKKWQKDFPTIHQLMVEQCLVFFILLPSVRFSLIILTSNGLPSYTIEHVTAPFGGKCFRAPSVVSERSEFITAGCFPVKLFFLCSSPFKASHTEQLPGWDSRTVSVEPQLISLLFFPSFF